MPYDHPYSSTDKIKLEVKTTALSILKQACGGCGYFAAVSSLLNHLEVEDYSVSMLPYWTFSGYDQNDLQIVPILTSWQLIQVAAKLFDDVEDNIGAASSGGANIGVASAQDIGIANGLIFASQLISERFNIGDLPIHRSSVIHRKMNEAALVACAGQYQDLSTDPQHIDPNTWLNIAYSKSGKLIAWAAWAGAFAAGVDKDVAENYHEFGYHLGALLQLADDYNDFWGNKDLDSGLPDSFSLTLPFCYVFHAASPAEQDALRGYILKYSSGDKTVFHPIRQLLIDVGAQKYLLATAAMLRKKAVEAVQTGQCPEVVWDSLCRIINKIFPLLPSIS